MHQRGSGYDAGCGAGVGSGEGIGRCESANKGDADAAAAAAAVAAAHGRRRRRRKKKGVKDAGDLQLTAIARPGSPAAHQRRASGTWNTDIGAGSGAWRRPRRGAWACNPSCPSPLAAGQAEPALKSRLSQESLPLSHQRARLGLPATVRR